MITQDGPEAERLFALFQHRKVTLDDWAVVAKFARAAQQRAEALLIEAEDSLTEEEQAAMNDELDKLAVALRLIDGEAVELILAT